MKWVKFWRALYKLKAEQRVLKGAYSCLQEQLYAQQVEIEDMRDRLLELECPPSQEEIEEYDVLFFEEEEF